MNFYRTHDEAAQALPGYVPTADEQAQIEACYDKAKWWTDRGEKALWETDGFSVTAFVSGPAAEDERKKAKHLLDGRMGVFRVFIRLSDHTIVATEPEEMPSFAHPERSDWKWVVRNQFGRMQRDAEGRWMTYPVSPKRDKTHTDRGYAERWVVLPYRLRDRKEAIGDAMKRGIAVSQLDRAPMVLGSAA